jgi:hypothetical protein
MEIQILPFQIKERVKVQGDMLWMCLDYHINNNKRRTLLEETKTKTRAIKFKAINLFKIQDRLLSSKWDNQDMLPKIK